MKREIKFRAYSSHNHKMYPVSDIEWDTDGRMWVTADDGKNGIELIDEEAHLMQYTGLNDKNGRKIYEGDIVKWGDTASLFEESPVRIAVVKFDPDICFYSSVGIFDYGSFAYKKTDEYLTVIGNIFENPELLEADHE